MTTEYEADTGKKSSRSFIQQATERLVGKKIDNECREPQLKLHD